MAATDKNYYDILGVGSSASLDEIKKSFKKLARKHHPDAGGDEAQFKEISEAYDTLSDAKKREEYDVFLKYGGFAGGAAGGAWGGRGQQGNWQTVTDFGDMGAWGSIFESMRSGEGAFGTQWDFPEMKARGRDVKVTLEVSFDEAFAGAEKRVTLNTGEGKTKRTQQLAIKVPKGAVDDSKLRYKGKGGAGKKGGANGDLIVTLKLKPHELYTRQGADVLFDLPVSFAEAALGASIVVPAPDGSKVKLRVPKGTQEDAVLVIKGKGAPRARSKNESSGDLKARIHIVVPKNLNEEQTAALEAYASADDPNELRPSFPTVESTKGA
ncbi:MAG: J domain-containing protein [Coriobacteriia bacterium]|jgi:curved DNA-binding protein|nr:J domain-containing protein [Coriobacteriia bacterium]MDR2714191.1 J domain-containing protein [Coriobacteriales bacterium]